MNQAIKRKLIAQQLLKQRNKNAIRSDKKYSLKEGQLIPMSPAQMRLWLLHSMDPENTAYNLVSCFSLNGKLNVKPLSLALNAIEKRHEMLRTVFRTNEKGEPYQHIQAPQGAPFNEVDLTGSDTITIDNIIKNLANTHFDFESGPLWEITLIKTDLEKFILVINVHHIAFDGWSLGIFVKELFNYYKEASFSGAVSPPVLPIQYSDYSLWSHQHINKSDEYNRHQNFWCEYLKDAPGVIALPYDFPRQQTPSSQGETKTLIMPRQQFEQICQLGQQQGITPFNIFMGILKVLLYRYTGQTHVVVGSPVSGRNEQDFHPLIGILANTLPITTTIDPSESFVKLISRIAKSSLQAIEHGDISFDSIVKATKPERIAGVNPIFQVFYAYQNKVDPGTVADVDVLYQIRDFGTTKFDLSLDVMEGPEGPTCIFEYDTQLFSSNTINRFIEHFDLLAKELIKNPNQSIASVNFINAEERQQLAPRDIKRFLPDKFKKSFCEQFQKVVESHKQRIAIVDNTEQLTYQELAQRVNCVLHGLQAYGIKPAQRIGVCIPRCSDLITAILAVNHVNGAFVVLDPEQPAERLQFIIENAQINTVIVSDDIEEFHSEFSNIQCIKISELRNYTATNVNSSLSHFSQNFQVSASSEAYCIYTSGTTGKPKGVAVTHGNWMNALYGWQQTYGLGDNIHNHLQLAHLIFDVFCGDIIRALGSGGKLVICDKETYAHPESLYALMVQEHIEFAEFVPTIFRPFADYLENSNQILRHIKLLVVASDSWYISEYHRFSSLLPSHAKLVNSYGLVECTIDSTWFEIGQTDAVLCGESNVPVGQAFPNVDCYVLDDNQQIQPYGLQGEIYIGGLGVVKGYIGLEQLTAERFIASPFVSGEILYRTGDLGIKRFDGSLSLIGRKDHQVKIRGQRVELAEVEANILRIDDIKKVAVTIQKNSNNQSMLVAYVVPANQVQKINVDEFKKSLLAWLPLYMIPEHFVVLQDIPLNQNGKVDRNKLPKISLEDRLSEQEFSTPETDTEQQLAENWSKIFKTISISRHHDFFALGGHSLTAVKMVTTVRTMFSVNISVQDIFSHSTLSALSARIDELKESNDTEVELLTPEVVQITPDVKQRFKPYPMTPIQQAYWIGRGDLFEFGNISAHSYDEFDVGDLDPARIESAWNKVIQQHDMLRTIVLEGGKLQALKDVPLYKITIEKLSNLKADDIEVSLHKVRDEMSHQIFDLTSWPTFDLRLSLLPNKRMLMHLSTDAIILDVRSFLIVLTDLLQFYADENREVKIQELTFRDYVIAECDRFKSPSFAKAQAYWMPRIPNLPPAPQLPLAKNPSDIKQPRFTRLHQRWNKNSWSTLKTIAAQIGITPTGLLLTAYAEILAEFSRDPAFSLNLTFLNRQPIHPDVDDVVGEFTSLTLLSIDNNINKDLASFKARARKIQADLWRDLEHSEMSGIEVLRELSRISGDSYRAKMPVVFTSALIMDVPQQIAGIDIKPLHTKSITQTSQVWLDCGVWEESGELLCNWDVVKEMYPDNFIENMFSQFVKLISRLAEDPSLFLQDNTREGALLSQSEIFKTSIFPLNFKPQYIGKSDDTLIQLFLDKVHQHKHAKALTTPELSLNYLELAQISYGILKTLLESTNQSHPFKNKLIAIIMHKGWEQIAATLGIMMAGGAYLPIDPDLPIERIQYILQHCDVKQIITQTSLIEELSYLNDYKLITVNSEIQPELDEHCKTYLPHADDLAYVIFTSGSTGQPKGVVIDQRGATNTILDCNQRYQISSSDAVFALSALNFDLSVYDIFGTLAAGATIVIPDHEMRLDPRHWLEQIHKHEVTVWNSVPALLGILINYCEQQNIALKGLRHAWVSGDWVPLNLSTRLNNICRDTAMTSMGGATEASIWSIAYPITLLNSSWQSIPYGKAMHNQRMYVLNHRLQHCPDWVVGDIYIGGIGLAKGYWKDECLTHSAFLTHPETGVRLYKTGDLGRLMSDGNIEFLGRADFQVKVQGHRIELGEIEHALLKQDGVKDAVVTAVGERHGDKILVAYLVATHINAIHTSTISRTLATTLPNYMVPRRYIELTEFPLSANGKVDRSGLPKPTTSMKNLKMGYRPASTHLQQTLVDLWQKLLNVEKIGIDDDFFQLGGDSMKAINMLANIHSSLGLNITFRQIMNGKTIEDISKILLTKK